MLRDVQTVITDVAAARFAAENLEGHKANKLLTSLNTSLMWAKELEEELKVKEALGGSR